MKECCKCKLFKELKEFNKNKSKKDGLATECKSCKKIQNKKYRKEHLSYYKIYYENNKIVLSEKKKDYVTKNKEEYCKRQHNWYIKNIDLVKKRVSLYKKEHPEQYQMYSNRRLAAKKSSVIDVFTVQNIIGKYGNCCFYCGGLFEEIDHYLPLSKGGTHTLDNVRPSCKQCNLTKSNKLPEDFNNYKRKLSK